MRKIPRSIKAGLDTEHFDIIRVMRARDLWCLQYRGSGYYFKTLRDMTSYCTERKWQNPLSS